MGSDSIGLDIRPVPRDFNPRSPDGERLIQFSATAIIIEFQSTLPGWGATNQQSKPTITSNNFNPRSPDGERPAIHPSLGACLIISIHAPRMGSDSLRIMLSICALLFQSTLPGWGATSRHSRRGRDARFQSTLPGWGATQRHFTVHSGDVISIHAPRMGSDDDAHPATNYHSTNFNPRSPDGERLPRRNRGSTVVYISIHAPRMGSDRENGHLRPRYGQNHPFSTLIVSQIVVDVLGTVRKSQKTPAH